MMKKLSKQIVKKALVVAVEKKCSVHILTTQYFNHPIVVLSNDIQDFISNNLEQKLIYSFNCKVWGYNKISEEQAEKILNDIIEENNLLVDQETVIEQETEYQLAAYIE